MVYRDEISLVYFLEAVLCPLAILPGQNLAYDLALDQGEWKRAKLS